MPAGRAAETATVDGAVAAAAGAAASTGAAAGGAEAAAAAETHWDCWDCRALEAGPGHAAGKKGQVTEFTWCFKTFRAIKLVHNLGDHCSDNQS